MNYKALAWAIGIPIGIVVIILGMIVATEATSLLLIVVTLCVIGYFIYQDLA